MLAIQELLEAAFIPASLFVMFTLIYGPVLIWGIGQIVHDIRAKREGG